MGLRIERVDSRKERSRRKDEGEGTENREEGFWEREIERDEYGGERSRWRTQGGLGSLRERCDMCEI
ncbi:hypothetical protein ACFXTO_008215 [Malus domestica]